MHIYIYTHVRTHLHANTHVSDKGFFNELVSHIASGPVKPFVLSKDHAIEEWRKLIGPANLEKAKEHAPNRYGAGCSRYGRLFIVG